MDFARYFFRQLFHHVIVKVVFYFLFSYRFENHGVAWLLLANNLMLITVQPH